MKKTIILLCTFLTSCALLKSQVMLQRNTTHDNPKPASYSNTTKAEHHYFMAEDSSIAKDSKYYLAKSKRQKTVAWILVGGGSLCAGIGILTFPDDYDPIFESSSDATENDAAFATVAIVAGFAAIITSVPVFVSSSINKRRAKVGMSYQKTGPGIPVNSAKEIAGFTLSIPIGR